MSISEWRRNTAKEKGFPRSSSCTIPHWKICASSSHRTCRSCARVWLGEKKVEMYGKEILDVLRASARANAPPRRQTKVSSPAKETLRLLVEGRTFEESPKSAPRTLRPSSL